MKLVYEFMGVKSECDNNKRALDEDSSHVIPSKLIHMCIGVFIKDVLNPFRAHLAKFWSYYDIEKVKNKHCDLHNLYINDITMRNFVDKTTVKSSFNEA